jgi:flagellar biosynthesis protein FlhG
VTVTDQASELRRMVKQISGPPAGGGAKPPRVLAVASGKGGVGKTNVAVNLAARLATMGRRVLLMDADLGLANADVLANVQTDANLAHVIAGRRSLEQVLREGPGGFTLLPGASGLAQMAALSEFERARVLQMMRQINADYDLVLVDTGAGISPNVLSFLLAADETLVVTTPEPTSITDAYALIKAVSRRRENAKISLLVNMVRDRIEARQVFDRINAVTRRFIGLSLQDAGYLVTDGRVGAAVRQRTPFVLMDPECAASMCITRLAHKLDRHAAEPRNSGLLRRVASWLAG